MNDTLKLVLTVAFLVVSAGVVWHFRDTDFGWVQQYIDSAKQKLTEAYTYVDKVYAEIKEWYAYILSWIEKVKS
jgi:hypothetical protein